MTDGEEIPRKSLSDVLQASYDKAFKDAVGDSEESPKGEVTPENVVPPATHEPPQMATEMGSQSPIPSEVPEEGVSSPGAEGGPEKVLPPRDETGKFTKVKIGEREFTPAELAAMVAEREAQETYQSLETQRLQQAEFALRQQQQELEQLRAQFTDPTRGGPQQGTSESAIFDYIRWRDQERANGNVVDIEDYALFQQQRYASGSQLTPEQVAAIVESKFQQYQQTQSQAAQEQQWKARDQYLHQSFDGWLLNALNAHSIFNGLTPEEMQAPAGAVIRSLYEDFSRRQLNPQMILTLEDRKIQDLLKVHAGKVAMIESRRMAKQMGQGIDKAVQNNQSLPVTPNEGGTPSLAQPAALRGGSVDASKHPNLDSYFNSWERDLQAKMSELDRMTRG